MLSAVVHYPRLSDPRLRAFRTENDPYADLIEEWRHVDQLTVIRLTDDLSTSENVFQIPLES